MSNQYDIHFNLYVINVIHFYTLIILYNDQINASLYFCWVTSSGCINYYAAHVFQSDNIFLFEKYS